MCVLYVLLYSPEAIPETSQGYPKALLVLKKHPRTSDEPAVAKQQSPASSHKRAPTGSKRTPLDVLEYQERPKMAPRCLQKSPQITRSSHSDVANQS